ncbi:hypothetical protein ASD42_30905 [Nocardia sp. Root136]|nr:hypothetical protein ASD42_30905 [Nocardia sp. Root136]
MLELAYFRNSKPTQHSHSDTDLTTDRMTVLRSKSGAGEFRQRTSPAAVHPIVEPESWSIRFG